MSVDASKELKNATYEVFMGALSVLSIINIFLVLASRDDVVDGVIVIMDGILSLIFLADFAFRILTAESKPQYFFRQFGWADLAASIPLPQAKFLRLFRVFRAVRLLRRRGPDQMVRDFVDNRAQSALLSVMLLIVLLLEFGGMGMAWAEQRSDQANIKTGGDSLWWAYVTITTVGYGDRFPVTDLGRLIGALVLTAGVGLFGVLTGFLANFFLAPKRPRRVRQAVTAIDPKSMLAAVRVQLEAHERASSELRARLEDIERTL
jgi:voltage-gated potassium channel Kch